MMFAAIAANLVDVKNIATHKCVLLSIHVPQEQAHLVLKAFGWPTMANPVPVAIAALDLSAASQKPAQAPAKPKQKWDEMPYAQQCGIRCAEPDFWRFVANAAALNIRTPDECAAAVRGMCRVTSRSEIKYGTDAGMRWSHIENNYQNWLATQQHAEYVR